MKKPFSKALLLLLILLPVTCNAKSFKRHFIVEFEQDGGVPERSFFIEYNKNTLSYDKSYSAETNDDSGSIFPPDHKSYRLGDYGETTPLIESIPWELIYVAHLLVAYKLVLTTSAPLLSAKPYSWIPAEAFVAVGILLKSYWNSNSSLFNPVDQLETSQHHPFAITTMVLPGQDQTENGQQNQASASSGQQASGTITRRGFFARFLSRGSGEGKENPEQHQHTFGLNCYVDSCNGVCQFRSQADSSRQPDRGEECPICFEMFGKVTVTPCCSNKIDTHCLKEIFLSTSPGSTKTCPFCRRDLSFLAESPDFAASVESQQDLTVADNKPSGISSSQTASFTNTMRALDLAVCEVILMDGIGRVLPCGKVCKNHAALANHVSHFHFRR
ncbi:hypothetical protein [Endozoicomonas sp. ALD040]|uniref:hypothetical protein n=1 Tax=unclassified Endozoicomonas TaxID=2644528 RepID=UPI003BB2157F